MHLPQATAGQTSGLLPRSFLSLVPWVPLLQPPFYSIFMVGHLLQGLSIQVSEESQESQQSLLCSYPRLPGMFLNLLEPCILLCGGRMAVHTSESCSHGNLCNPHHCRSHHQLLWGLAQAPFLFAKTSTSLKSSYPSVSLSYSFWAWDLEPCHAPASSSVWGKDMSTELSQLVC